MIPGLPCAAEAAVPELLPQSLPGGFPQPGLREKEESCFFVMGF